MRKKKKIRSSGNGAGQYGLGPWQLSSSLESSEGERLDSIGGRRT